VAVTRDELTPPQLRAASYAGIWVTG
jgi:hypothetical protein